MQSRQTDMMFLVVAPSSELKGAGQAYDRLSHDEAIARKLQVMDTAAFALTRDNGFPIVVFSVDEPGAIPSALLGKRRPT
jgi:uridylate kinase